MTGAAGSGKSTVCGALAGNTAGLLALDGDVFAAGASATQDPPDYVSFWAYLLAVTREIHQNETDVVWCGLCRPDQIAAQPAGELDGFTSIDMLVLSCDREGLLQRLSSRPGGQRALGRADVHTRLNDDLRSQRSRGRIRISHLDTTTLTVQQTIQQATGWARKNIRDQDTRS